MRKYFKKTFRRSVNSSSPKFTTIVNKRSFYITFHYRLVERCYIQSLIILGVIDLDDMTVETPETVATRIRRALPYKDPKQIIVAPDCGMKYLPRDV